MSQIEIDESTIELSTGSGQLITNNFHWFYVSETQFLTIQYNEIVFRENDNYSISIGFKGLLKNDNAGFYRSFYLDDNGNKRFLRRNFIYFI